jgi:hypothetical protein
MKAHSMVSDDDDAEDEFVALETNKSLPRLEVHLALVISIRLHKFELALK